MNKRNPLNLTKIPLLKFKTWKLIYNGTVRSFECKDIHRQLEERVLKPDFKLDTRPLIEYLVKEVLIPKEHIKSKKEELMRKLEDFAFYLDYVFKYDKLHVNIYERTEPWQPVPKKQPHQFERNRLAKYLFTHVEHGYKRNKYPNFIEKIEFRTDEGKDTYYLFNERVFKNQLICSSLYLKFEDMYLDWYKQVLVEASIYEETIKLDFYMVLDEKLDDDDYYFDDNIL
jgi:hypothetical protein